MDINRVQERQVLSVSMPRIARCADSDVGMTHGNDVFARSTHILTSRIPVRWEH